MVTVLIFSKTHQFLRVNLLLSSFSTSHWPVAFCDNSSDTVKQCAQHVLRPLELYNNKRVRVHCALNVAFFFNLTSGTAQQ